MAVKKCAICGGDFATGGNGKICEACKVQPCAVCGNPVELDSYKRTQMIKRGWVTCSVQCGSKISGESSRGKPHPTRKEVVCDLCGKSFIGKGASRTCDDCRTVKCAVCGESMRLSGPKLSRYKKLVADGDPRLTCGKDECRAALTRTRLIEREGIVNVGQRGDVREASRQARLNESDKVKAKRSASLRESCSKSEVIEARRRTNIERTGYGFQLQNPEILAKAQAAAHTPEAIRKSQETFASHNGGAKTPFQIKEVQESIIAERGKGRQEKVQRVRGYMAEHPNAAPREVCRATGIKYHSLLDLNRSYGLGLKMWASSYEEEFARLLDKRGIAYEREYRMSDDEHDRRSCPRYDFLVGDTCVEIDPWHYHNSTKVDAWYGEVEPPTPYSHLRKSEYAMKAEGKRCVHVFDWDDYDKVADLFIPKTFVNAADLELVAYDKATPEIKSFIDDNHLQGMCRGTLVAYALVGDDGIMSVMTFGKPRFGGGFDWELLRYCAKVGYAVRGGSVALFDAFLAENGGSVVSYCDNSKFDGKVYGKLGFVLDNKPTPLLHWYNPDTGQHFTGELVNRLGVDRLLKTEYGKGARNDELMIKEGFVEIYDCGQARWVRRG